MWKAFQAAHEQASHAIGTLTGYEGSECMGCAAYFSGEGESGCARWQQWQRKVSDGFGGM